MPGLRRPGAFRCGSRWNGPLLGEFRHSVKPMPIPEERTFGGRPLSQGAQLLERPAGQARQPSVLSMGLSACPCAGVAKGDVPPNRRGRAGAGWRSGLAVDPYARALAGVATAFSGGAAACSALEAEFRRVLARLPPRCRPNRGPSVMDSKNGWQWTRCRQAHHREWS